MNKKCGLWTIQESKLIYQNPHIQVVEDQVIQPDGQPGYYATVDRPAGVSVLPIDPDGNVYLTRQFRYAIGEESLEVVSGGMQGEIFHAPSGLLILKAQRLIESI